ncbi:MAG: hypothetical protein JWP25_6252 [Bradyrhizobium sp.]|nr:hypothetical protein [Bradyrhizobium sp.]
MANEHLVNLALIFLLVGVVLPFFGGLYHALLDFLLFG